MKKRILGLLLSLVMVISLFPAITVSAEEPTEQTSDTPLYAEATEAQLPTISEPPTPVMWGLEYNGYEQELVDDSNCEVEGGSLMYRIGTEGNWSSEIPTAKNAGTYYIYWMIAGADGYADYIAEEPFEVTIEKTILNIEAKTYYLQIGDTAPDLTAPDTYEIYGFQG